MVHWRSDFFSPSCTLLVAMYFSGGSLGEAVFMRRILSLPLPHSFVIPSNDLHCM